jgi:hypothetical protein
MAEQKNWFLLRFSREIYLQVISIVGGSMEFGASAKSGELFGYECAAAVDCVFVVAGRLEFDEPADGVDHLVAVLFEVMELGRCRTTRFVGVNRFLRIFGHRCGCCVCAVQYNLRAVRHH